MIALCDTSVFVAGILDEHVHHLPSVQFLARVKNNKIPCSVATHALAECYSVLSAMKRDNSPQTVLEVLEENITGHFDVISLNRDDYWEALRRVAGKNLRSGAIFDALIFQAAVKKKATHLITWDVRDFERLSNGEVRVVTPEAL